MIAPSPGWTLDAHAVVLVGINLRERRFGDGYLINLNARAAI
jgi:hypothetical protein